MINPEFMTELLDYINKMSCSIKQIGEDEAAKLHCEVTDKFISNPNRVWWWEALSCEVYTIDYGETDGLEILRNMFKDDILTVYLFVTNDEPNPWPIFKGNLVDILEMISEQSYFEYFFVDESLKWIVFDTHHNLLVFGGEMVSKAKNWSPSPPEK